MTMAEYNNTDTAELQTGKRAKRSPGIDSTLVDVDLGACTHEGHVRQNNEDHYTVARIERSLETLLTNMPPGMLPARHAEVGYGLLVADGMGGAAAGEIASQTAITSLLELAVQTPDWHMRLDYEGANEVLSRMDQRFGQMREALIERAQSDPSLAGMGTTMTVAISLGENLVIAHIGDSRAYLFHKDRLHLLTRDQTLAQDLADIGVIKPAEVTTHYARHVLTGVIGTEGKESQAELCQVWLADGDQVLLCTDGLTEMVSDEGIVEVLKENQSSDAACRALVDMALESGGLDNVTVVLARYHIPDDASSSSAK
jgi:protein phosphatase